MAAFELLFGRLVMEFSWVRILADYDLTQGGLMPFGLVVLFFAPLVASRMRAGSVQPRSFRGDAK